MGIGIDGAGDSAQRSGIPSGTSGTLSGGGFSDFYAGVWVYRASADVTHANTAGGAIIHGQAGAREVVLGFDSAGSNLSDLSLRMIFNSGGGSGTPYFFPAHQGDDFLDEWVHYFMLAAGGATGSQRAGYIRLADLANPVVQLRTNDNASSQYINTLTFGNTSANNARVTGDYAFARAVASASLTVSDVQSRCNNPATVAGDWGFWPLDNNTDTGDDSGNSRALTFNGTLTSEASPTLGAGSAIVASLLAGLVGGGKLRGGILRG